MKAAPCARWRKLLAYNFNDETGFTPGGETPSSTSAAAAESPATTSPEPAAAEAPQSAGNAAFCTHREVKPYAGTAGFDADAWCPECQYYKLRRAPKKRSPSDDYSY